MPYFEVNRRRNSLVLWIRKRKAQITHSLAFLITLPELHSYTPIWHPWLQWFHFFGEENVKAILHWGTFRANQNHLKIHVCSVQIQSSSRAQFTFFSVFSWCWTREFLFHCQAVAHIHPPWFSMSPCAGTFTTAQQFLERPSFKCSMNCTQNRGRGAQGQPSTKVS